MSYTYTTYVEALANTLVVDPANANFVIELPSIIDYAEQRIYRELDLLSTRVIDTNDTVANNRYMNLPQTSGRFVVVEEMSVYTTAGQVTSRNPMVPASVAYINAAWPTAVAATSTQIPQVFAMVTDQMVLFGPPPGAAFTVEVIGTIRPTAFSATNQTTYLSLYLPDLFFAASMVFGAGYQKNFGAQADDPKLALSWESQYQTLLRSADGEEARKRFAAASWSSKRIEPTAQPQRG